MDTKQNPANIIDAPCRKAATNFSPYDDSVVIETIKS